MLRTERDAQDWASECPDVKNYKQRLNPAWHRMLYSCTHMATVGFKGLITYSHATSTCCSADVSSLVFSATDDFSSDISPNCSSMVALRPSRSAYVTERTNSNSLDSFIYLITTFTNTRHESTLRPCELKQEY